MARTAAQERAQANRNTIFVEEGEIMSVETFASDQFIQRIRAPKCAAAARPGTFVHLTCDESLPMRRPLSTPQDTDKVSQPGGLAAEGATTTSDTMGRASTISIWPCTL